MTAYKDGFKMLNLSNNRRLLVYMDARQISLYDKSRKEYQNFYHQEKLNGLAFENEIYYPYENLEILKEYHFIEHLYICQKNITDLTGLKYAKRLKGLYVMENKAALDFSLDNIRCNLRYLSLNWHYKVSKMNCLSSLATLRLTRDRDEVKLPINIEEIQLDFTHRTNLDIFEGFTALKRLSIHKASKLNDIGGLSDCGDTLEELELAYCKNLRDYSPILKLSKLKVLKINNYHKSCISNLESLRSKIQLRTQVLI